MRAASIFFSAGLERRMLDASVYLTSFGWKGKGNGLRQGSASRPLAIPQKRTLAGLGKDRDEAFPFWDHLFATAAKTIQIKVFGEGAASNESDLDTQSTLLRTTTGILSNRRPTGATPVTSGTVTPSDSYPIPRLSLLATAKRESARRQLYAAFFRGPVLGPDVEHDVKSAADNEFETVEHCHIDPDLYLERQKQAKENKKRKRHDIQELVDHGTCRKTVINCQDIGELIITTVPEGGKDKERKTSKVKRKKTELIVSDDASETAGRKRERKKLKAMRKEERRYKREERHKATTKVYLPSHNH